MCPVSQYHILMPLNAIGISFKFPVQFSFVSPLLKNLSNNAEIT